MAKVFTSSDSGYLRFIMFRFLIYAFFLYASAAQSYNERNVLPPDKLPTSNKDVYDYYMERHKYDDEDDMIHNWRVEEYPHPENNYKFCNRRKPSFICDPDMILPMEHADYLDSYIRKLYKETSCLCDTCFSEEGGIVVGIALLRKIHRAKGIRPFTETLRQTWRLGKCNNDLLIVVVTMHRLFYMDIGNNTTGCLTFQDAYNIYWANTNKFYNRHFFEGLRDMLEGYHAATMNMTQSLKDIDQGIALRTGVIVGTIFLLGIALFIGFVVYRKYRNEPDEKNGNQLKEQIDLTIR